MSDLEGAQARAAYLFVLPSFALYFIFVLVPVAVTILLSFSYYDPMEGSRWVGLRIFSGSSPMTVRCKFFGIRFDLRSSQ